MELKLKLCDKNNFPLTGILIKGAEVEIWLKEIQYIGFSLDQVKAFPVPGNVPDSVWGCLIEFIGERHSIDVGRNVFCQCMNDLLFIPERTMLFPQLSREEVGKLFSEKKHLFHPEIGLAALEEQIDWQELVLVNAPLIKDIRQPAPSIFLPKQIRNFQIRPVELEEVLKQMDEKIFPKQEKFKEQPLNPFEKLKLFLYKRLFLKKQSTADDGQSSIENKPRFAQFEKLSKLFTKKADQWADKLQADFEDLERRSQKHVDRLMELLKKNPEEALKYAIPLDSDGVSRLRGVSSFSLEKRWFDFSLSRNNSNSTGPRAIMSGDSFIQLQNQYINTAQELVKQKDFKKAAFVYMKLLKNYPMAAQTLEQGGYYPEAASVYLKYCHNKQKAAACFESANMTDNAIELYKELYEDEKVGDLYYALHKKKEALFYYQKVADQHERIFRCVKAALLYRNKMGNEEAAQKVLLKGWHANKDAFNCLNNYLANVRDEKQLWIEIQQLYADTDAYNKETFLRVLQYEYNKDNELAEGIKDMAYEIIAEQAKVNPSIVSELKAFNKTDKQLIKDTLRFKVNFKKST